MQEYYAENVNYWKSSKTPPDTWLDHAKKEITKVGGKITGEGFFNDPTSTLRAFYMLTFEIEDVRYKAIWPVLKSKKNDMKAARIQAATLLYHDVKQSCVRVKVLGAHVAFLPYLVLPNGHSMMELKVQDVKRLAAPTNTQIEAAGKEYKIEET